MVLNALNKAFKIAKPQILNSDQGCQFTSQQYIDFVKENGIRQSMDGKSRWADNIMIERWFRSFKYEEAYLTQYNNIKEARAAIKRYVHTYNFERYHSTSIIPITAWTGMNQSSEKTEERTGITIGRCFLFVGKIKHRICRNWECFI